MASETHRQEGQDSALSRLNVAIDTLNLAKDICSIAPAQAAFGAASALLTMIRVRGPILWWRVFDSRSFRTLWQMNKITLNSG